MAIIPTVENVTLGALSKADFDLANKFSFSTGILISICKDKLLVEKGDFFKFPQELDLQEKIACDSLSKGLKILDCQPFHKGTVTINTKFVVVDISDKQKTQVDSQNKICAQAIHLSEFVSPLTFDTISTSLSHGPCSDWMSQLDTYIKVDALVTNCVCIRQDRDNNYDPSYSIFMPKNVAKQYKFFHESIVEIIKNNTKLLSQQFDSRDRNGRAQLSQKHRRRKNKSTIATIFIVQSDAVQICPTLAFNVSKHDEMSPCKDLLLRVSVKIVIM